MDHILFLLSMAQISTSAQVFDFTVVPGAIWDSSPVPHEIMEGVGRAAHKALSCCQSPKRRMCCLKCPLLWGAAAEQMEQCILVTSAVQACKLHYTAKHAELPLLTSLLTVCSAWSRFIPPTGVTEVCFCIKVTLHVLSHPLVGISVRPRKCTGVCMNSSFNENTNGHFHALINAASLCSKKDRFWRSDKQKIYFVRHCVKYWW